MKGFWSHPVLALILKFCISAILLIGLIWYIDVQTLIETIHSADTFLLSAGFLIITINFTIHFYRWKYLLHILDKNLTNQEIITSFFIGYTTGFFTPGNIGEVIGRIASHPHLRKSHIVGITLVDKLYVWITIIVLGIVGLTLFCYFYTPVYWNFLYLPIMILILLVVCILSLRLRNSTKILSLIPKKIREHKLYTVAEVIEKRCTNRHGQILLGTTLALYLSIFAQYFIYLRAFEAVSFFDSFLCVSSVYLVKTIIIPFSIGDLGVRETAAVFFFTKIGVTAASAFCASFCMFLSNIIAPNIIGALLVIRLKRR